MEENNEDETPLFEQLTPIEFEKEKSLYDMYKKVSPSINILNIGNDTIEKIITQSYKLPNPETNEEGKSKLEIEKEREGLYETYLNIQDLLKSYLDLEPRYYPIIALWIIGASNHKSFICFPYLFLNAMKGSGKTRLLKLLAYLCNGSMLNSIREASLFRSKEMLSIDEFEGISRQGNEALRELLNSAYKQGSKVKRMKKVFNKAGEEQVEESFEVFRPIAMANISGGETVLEDRCLFFILEKSNNPVQINKAEVWEFEEIAPKIKEFLARPCSLCMKSVVLEMYIGWNKYLTTHIHNYTNYTNYTLNTEKINNNKFQKVHFFYEKIDESGIRGRNFELCFPLLFIAFQISNKVFLETIDNLKFLMDEKKMEDITESKDILLIDFISQLPEKDKWIRLKDLLTSFKITIQSEDIWMNDRWLGKALRRLKLFKEKKRVHSGINYILDIDKAQEKMKMFK